MKFWSNVVARFRADANSHVFCAVITTLLGTIFVFLMQQGHHSRLALIGAGALAGFIGSLSALGRERYLNSLARRSNENRPIEWDVTVNSVKVGTISDSDYASVRYYVYRDNQMWLAKLFACIKNILNLAKQDGFGVTDRPRVGRDRAYIVRPEPDHFDLHDRDPCIAR
jgi:hypothetical protein